MQFKDLEHFQFMELNDLCFFFRLKFEQNFRVDDTVLLYLLNVCKHHQKSISTRENPKSINKYLFSLYRLYQLIIRLHSLCH